MSRSDYRIAWARFMARSYDVQVTEDGRILVDGLDCTAEIDAKYDPEAHYSPSVN